MENKKQPLPVERKRSKGEGGYKESKTAGFLANYLRPSAHHDLHAQQAAEANEIVFPMDQAFPRYLGDAVKPQLSIATNKTSGLACLSNSRKVFQ